jgi:hypothetical protein
MWGCRKGDVYMGFMGFHGIYIVGFHEI